IFHYFSLHSLSNSPQTLLQPSKTTLARIQPSKFESKGFYSSKMLWRN
ncbi:Uncharacterized protein TCM_027628, partial [Theobroma cacao]